MFSTQSVTLYIHITQASQQSYYVDIVYMYLTTIIEWFPIAKPFFTVCYTSYYDSIYQISSLYVKAIISYGILKF